MKKFLNSLLLKILLLCSGLVLLSSVSIQYFAYQTAESTVEKTMGHSALNIIGSVNNVIDIDKFTDLKTAEDMEQEYYTQLREELNQIKNTTGLKYLYTMRKVEDGSYIYVVDGMEMGSEDASLLGDVESELSPKQKASFDGTEDYELNHTDEYGWLISGYVPIKNNSDEVVGIIGADFDAQYMVDQLAKANFDMFKIVTFVVVISILIAVAFSYMIIRSLKKLQAKIQVVKNGDLTVQVAMKRKDEIGELSEAFQSMINHMSSMIYHIRNHSDEVVREVESLNASADISISATEEITKIVGEIALGATTQVENVEMVGTSMEQVFTKIENITNNISLVNANSDQCMKDMQDASEKLENSVTQINLVNDTVDNTASLMKKLEDKFKEILAFSDIVSAIAKKTNLLALNASIEAASAGEHGKGFSVVATEIKNLARQSSDASKKINDLIMQLQSEIDMSSDAIGEGVTQARNSVLVMSEVEQYLSKLSNSHETMNSRIKEIADAILQIEDNSKNVLDKTVSLAHFSHELNSGTQQTSAQTEEQYAIMEGIKNDLVNVKQMMEELEENVNLFTIS